MAVKIATRVWEPLNPRSEAALLTDTIRVRRERQMFMGPHKQALYCVEVHNGDSWMPMTDWLPNASHAFRRARRMVTGASDA